MFLSISLSGSLAPKDLAIFVRHRAFTKSQRLSQHLSGYKKINKDISGINGSPPVVFITVNQP